MYSESVHRMFRKKGSELHSVGSEDNRQRSTEFGSWSWWSLITSILSHLWSKKSSSLNRSWVIGWQTVCSRTCSWRIRCGTGTRRSLICPTIILLFVCIWRVSYWRPADGSTTTRTRFFVKLVRLVTRSIVVCDGWFLIHVKFGLFEIGLCRVKVASVQIRLGTWVQVFWVRVHAHSECTGWHVGCSVLVRLHWVLHCVHRAHDLKQQ